MGKIIGVQFQKNGKLYYFDSNGIETRPGDYVIVDTARGYDLGEVSMGSRDIDEASWHTPLKKTIRIATEQDIQHSRDNRLKEQEAFSICQKKITEHELEMKLVSVEYAFDNSKIMFFFTANGRVDFRSLVKDLASIFKMRIELRQIGVRDEAKILGGLGPCGRPICCGTFLDQFQPVSIKMAKEQNLSLNPTKISGVCGRLMCCLKYEQEHYEQTRKRMPKIGREVTTPDGKGPVTDLNIVKETVFVRLTNGDTSEIKEYPLDEIVRPQDAAAASSESVQKPRFTDSAVLPTEDTEQCAFSADEEKSYEVFSEANPHASVHPSVPKHTSSGDKSKTKQRKGALGQPVKRENPNRTDTAQTRSENIPCGTSVTEEQIQCGKNPQETRNSWADALQKAMQAISQDK